MHRTLTAFLPGSLLLMSCATVGGPTVVRVLSRRRIGTQVAAKEDYSPEILSQIEVRLDLMHP
jgi:hypothetical protein